MIYNNYHQQAPQAPRAKHAPTLAVAYHLATFQRSNEQAHCAPPCTSPIPKHFQPSAQDANYTPGQFLSGYA